MIKLSAIFTLLMLIMIASINAMAKSAPFPPSPAGTLFANQEALNIVVTAPLKKLFDSFSLDLPKEKQLRVKGSLSYIDEDGKKVTIPAIFKVKGNSSTECDFKKVELKFNNQDTAGTLFAGMKSVDLNTHCFMKNSESPDFNNHREGVLYEIAKLLKIPTYQARPAFVKYLGTGLKESEMKEPFQALFVEDRGDLLRRLGAQEIKEPTLKRLSSYAHRQIDNEDIKRLRVFNEMIGNEDFMYPGQFSESEKNVEKYDGEVLWNIKVIAVDDHHWVPLTHDFNLATIIEFYSPYNKWDEGSYREMLDNDKLIRSIRSEFIARKSEILQIVKKRLVNDPVGHENMRQSLLSYFNYYK